MKYIIFMLSMLGFGHGLFAQVGFNSLGVSTGMSTANSKFFTLSYEGAGANKLHLGVQLQGILYSEFARHHYSFTSQTTYVSAGLFFTYNLATTRNFLTNFRFGAAGGSDNSRFIWYPFGGFEQVIFVAPKTQLVFSEQVLYLFVKEDAFQWQPSLNVGFKFSL